MTQPDYVPVTSGNQVRPVDLLPTPAPWNADRPGEVRGATQPSGAGMGTPGPDQGYALHLAGHFADRLVLCEGERAEDSMAGCLGAVLRRAALFGRAPVIHDWTVALTVWGFLGTAPEDLVAYRRPLFLGASHDYWDQRVITDLVPATTLRLAPERAREGLGEWRRLLVVPPAPTA